MLYVLGEPHEFVFRVKIKMIRHVVLISPYKDTLRIWQLILAEVRRWAVIITIFIVVIAVEKDFLQSSFPNTKEINCV